MIRRSRLALAIPLTLLAVSACGGGDSSTDEGLGADDFTVSRFDLSSTRTGSTTRLVSSDGDVVLDVPDSALPAGLDSSTITASVTRLAVTDGSSAIQLDLGPDGTEFDEPITITWSGSWDTDGLVSVVAHSADGTNLLTSPEEAQAVLDTLTVVDNDDGSSSISVEIEHFSSWVFLNAGSLKAVYDEDPVADRSIGASFDRSSVDLEVGQSETATMLVGISDDLRASMRDTGELCVLPWVDSSLEFVSISTSSGPRCEPKRQMIEVRHEFTCRDPRSGKVMIAPLVTFGMSDLNPLQFFMVLIAGKQARRGDMNDLLGNPDDEIVSYIADFAIYLQLTWRIDVNCRAVAATTLPSESTTTLSDDSSSNPSTTVTPGRPVSGGSGTTTSIAGTSTTTLQPTTTLRATTTTKPRQGATTTLPRPSTGGTTTLP